VAAEAFFVAFSAVFSVFRLFDNNLRLLPLLFVLAATFSFSAIEVVAVQRKHTIHNFPKILFEKDEVRSEQLILLIYSYLSEVDLARVDNVVVVGMVAQHKEECAEPFCVCRSLLR